MAFELIDLDPRPMLRAHTTSGHWYSHKLDTLCIGTGAVADIRSIVAHEFNHFLTHAWTPYGLVLDELWSMQVQSASAIASCLVQEPGVGFIPYPIYDLARTWRDARSSLGGNRAFPEVFEWLFMGQVQPWSKYQALERVLEGGSFSAHYDQASAVGWLQLFEQQSANALGQSRGPRPRADGPYPSAPVGGSAGGPRQRLGGHHIFEAIAQLSEWKGPTYDHVARYEDYWVLWLSTITAYGPKRYAHDGSNEPLLPSFLAICDLALFTPIGAVYSSLRHPRSGWIDLQPGYRFSQALKSVQRVGWLTTAHEGYETLENAICDDLDWPRPREFLETGGSLVGDHEWLQRHRDGCRLRLANFNAPFHLIEDELDEAIKELWHVYPPIVCRQGTTRIMPSRTTERLTNYYVSTWSDAIMRISSFDPLTCVPPDILWSAIDSSPPMARAEDFIDFVSAAAGWLQPARLKPWRTLLGG